MLKSCTLVCAVALFLFIVVHPLQAQYHLFPDEGNLVSQTIIETNDGGLFIAALEFCYTPGTTVIEGCTFALHLVNTKANGDTLWTNRIPYYTQYGPNLQLFENSDGSFTIIAMTNETYSCNGISIGLSGFRQIEVMNISPAGQLVLENSFPDDCELTLVDALRLDDNLFLVVSYFEDPIFNFGSYEGRIFLMDATGTILGQRTVQGERFRDGRLIVYGNNDFLLAYINAGGQLTFDRYDDQLNLLSSVVNTTAQNVCINEAKKLSDGNIGLFCSPISSSYEIAMLSKYDLQANQLWERTYTLEWAAGFVEDNGGNFLLPSRHSDNNELDVKLTTLNSNGDSLQSEVFVYPNQESPSGILLTSTGELAITGSANCCNNVDTLIGPAQTFLLLPGPITSTSPVDPEPLVRVFPNPVRSVLQIDFLEKPSKVDAGWTITLYSLLGKEVKRQKVQAGEAIDVSALTKGTYFYTLHEGGEIITSGKVIRD